MKKTKTKDPPKGKTTYRTMEARENYMINLAMNLAEQQLEEGTASSQVITHYLKLGTTREKKEQLRLEKEIALMNQKTKALQTAENIEELYKEAIKAMKHYSGNDSEDLEEEDYYE